MNSDDFQQILESMWYRLIDCGDHWRTQALYRSGDTQTAVKIYKNTGVWMDFVINKGSKPFEALVRETLKGADGNLTKLLSKVKNADPPITYKKKDTIEMEKIYPPDALDKLFPNYSFYKKRLISEETQKKFQVGLAGVGKMYRRMVFPIYNEHNQIIGFSGRKVTNDDRPKWLHRVDKNKWIYPSFLNDYILKESREVILVESIGDMLSLWDAGIKNSLVTFGTSISDSLIYYLISIRPDKILIALNNDGENKAGNRGALKILKNLKYYFQEKDCIIALPFKNDFNEMTKAEILEWKNNA